MAEETEGRLNNRPSGQGNMANRREIAARIAIAKERAAVGAKDSRWRGGGDYYYELTPEGVKVTGGPAAKSLQGKTVLVRFDNPATGPMLDAILQEWGGRDTEFGVTAPPASGMEKAQEGPAMAQKGADKMAKDTSGGTALEINEPPPSEWAAAPMSFARPGEDTAAMEREAQKDLRAYKDAINRDSIAVDKAPAVQAARAIQQGGSLTVYDPDTDRYVPRDMAPKRLGW